MWSCLLFCLPLSFGYTSTTLVAFETTLHLLFDKVFPWVMWNPIVWRMHPVPHGYTKNAMNVLYILI